MAEPISRFRQRYPGVELKIAEFGGLTVQQAVSNGELDMAMTALPVEEDSSLTILPLFNHPLCVLTPGPRSGKVKPRSRRPSWRRIRWLSTTRNLPLASS